MMRIINASIDKYYLFFMDEELNNDIYTYTFKDMLNNEIKFKSFERIDYTTSKYLVETKLNYIYSCEVVHE